MIIEKAKEEDLFGIVELLKKSLGQSKLPKTMEIWAYKHLENPFGKSIVLVGKENNEIIGVRAFMKWEWTHNNKVFRSLRAVDTATHPSHQGKGVFKRLTLEAIDIAKAEGYHLIFNTPNSQSLPGYLKMGWVKVNKLNVQIEPVNPFFWHSLKKGVSYVHTIKDSTDEDLSSTLRIYNQRLNEDKLFFTSKSIGYLNWRYKHNPLQDYEIIQDKDFFVACYVKEHSKFNELRCSEIICRDKSGIKKALKALRKIAKKMGVQIISSHVLEERNSLRQINGFYGPILTLKDLNLSENEKVEFNQMGNWGYTLGDLELF